ncbi:unnamed protein product [Phaedon cochleariae]|uniref:ER-bound oxygenase mpaB/mpaB'/Rubber oxygenase catalytic domain-containing protein n=1 Tax=Phaedon cochleariae TaxID=80249 RepID=A0A9P0DQH3_PHACE|nr:unnamed protein product [Phaedon cochleariae]
MHHYITSASRTVFESEEKCFLVEKLENVTCRQKRRIPKRKKEIGCDNKTGENRDFSAEKFVEELLNEAGQHSCDETSDAFNESTDIPNFYDEKLFRKGQQFFYKYIFSLFFSNILGLLLLCGFSETLNILKMTNKSSTPMTAYKRYMATIFHMMTWYDSDFKPGSRSWLSLRKVRLLHNHSSKQSNSTLKYRINQKQMSITLFGFMGLGLIRSKMLGIHKATEEEWRGFIHLWRVIGYALGIEDRFNICRESVSETKSICNLLVERVFIPVMKKPADDFHMMTKAMLDGLWAMNPVLRHDVFVQFAQMVMDDDKDPNYKNEHLPELTEQGKKTLKLLLGITWALQYSVIRIFLNLTQVLALRIMKVFPFLALYKFGVDHSYVKI